MSAAVEVAAALAWELTLGAQAVDRLFTGTEDEGDHQDRADEDGP